MARWLALVLLLGLGTINWGATAAAEVALSDRDQAAIRMTIERQLAAFQRDDGTTAFTYAAPSIKEKFGTPANFMNMVRTGYAPVYRPREVDFRKIVTLDGVPTQEVLVVDQSGIAYIAYYQMQQQPDGRWLIKGCILGRIADRGV